MKIAPKFVSEAVRSTKDQAKNVWKSHRVEALKESGKKMAKVAAWVLAINAGIAALVTPVLIVANIIVLAGAIAFFAVTVMPMIKKIAELVATLGLGCSGYGTATAFIPAIGLLTP